MGIENEKDKEKKKVNDYNLSLKEIRRRTVIRMIISVILFSGASVALFVFSFKIPLAPEFLEIDLSVFFELLAAIAYGPLIGAIVCLLKTILCFVFVKGAAISAFLNFLVETTFVAVAGYFYLRSASVFNASDKPGRQRRKRIILGSLIGMVPALAVQFVITNNYIFKLFDKYYSAYGYTKEYFIESYASSADTIASKIPDFLGSLVPKITELWQGILVFNTPITFLKYLVVALIVMLIYPFVSNFLHFKAKKK